VRAVKAAPTNAANPSSAVTSAVRVAVCAATRSLTSGIWPYSDSGQDHTNSAVATATATRPALSQLRPLTPLF
jgi:hypothetical protein